MALGLRIWELPKPNPYSPATATYRARRQVTHPTRRWKGLCAKACAHWNGWEGSGEASARTLRHHQVHLYTDRHPPAGALVHFAIGEFDHVAESLGAGVLASNDILRVGFIDLVSISKIEQAWGAEYKGWSLPYFPLAWGPYAKPTPIPKPVPVPVKAVSVAALNKQIKAGEGPLILLLAKRFRKLGYTGFIVNDKWGPGKAATVKKLQRKYFRGKVYSTIGPAFLKNLFHGDVSVKVTP
jgi:hypothetical protein